jgi:hypothetical protein
MLLPNDVLIIGIESKIVDGDIIGLLTKFEVITKLLTGLAFGVIFPSVE